MIQLLENPVRQRRISLLKAQSNQHFCFLVSILALPLAAHRHCVPSLRDCSEGPVVTRVPWSGPGSWAPCRGAVLPVGSAASPGQQFQHLVSLCPQTESRTCHAGAYTHQEIHGDWCPIPGGEKRDSISAHFPLELDCAVPQLYYLQSSPSYTTIPFPNLKIGSATLSPRSGRASALLTQKGLRTQDLPDLPRALP